jgi:hypothetical protein
VGSTPTPGTTISLPHHFPNISGISLVNFSCIPRVPNLRKSNVKHRNKRFKKFHESISLVELFQWGRSKTWQNENALCADYACRRAYETISRENVRSADGFGNNPRQPKGSGVSFCLANQSGKLRKTAALTPSSRKRRTFFHRINTYGHSFRFVEWAKFLGGDHALCYRVAR